VYFLHFFACGATGLGLLIVEVYRSQNLTHTHAHAHKHTTGINPLNDWSARRRGRNLYKKKTNITNTHAPSGIRTRNPSNRATADFASFCSPDKSYVQMLVEIFFNTFISDISGKKQSEAFHPEFSHKFPLACRHQLDSQATWSKLYGVIMKSSLSDAALF